VGRKRLARQIRTRRKTIGLTQEQLAKRMHVSRNYVARLEMGDRKNPSLAILKRLAKALGVPVTALLG
jgi:transcriptional regulator with XRE-family HTH domain